VKIRPLTTSANQNSIREEIKSRLKSGNACYHSVQNLVFQFAFQKLEDLRYTEL